MPNADSIYSYQNFLRAVAKFPAFCGESNGDFGIDDACKRELAALFAHMIVTSDGLSTREDASSSEVFKARGPLGLSGQNDYK